MLETAAASAPTFPPDPSTPAVRTGGRSVLESAFALLSALEQVDEAGVTRLAAQCGLPKTTAHRLLEQLITLGAVERSGGGYRIGARVFQLGHCWQPHPGLRAAVREPMKRLASATGATVTVNVLRNGRDLIVDWTPGTSGSPVALRRGATWPWNTAAGKMLVAEAYRGHAATDPSGPTGSATPANPETETPAAENIAGRGLPALSPLPTAVPASWRHEAEAIRVRGVAFDREEIIAGVCCAAVPLYGSPGTPVAALCVITDPGHRLDRLAEAARRTAGAVSAVLRSGPSPHKARRRPDPVSAGPWI